MPVAALVIWPLLGAAIGMFTRSKFAEESRLGRGGAVGVGAAASLVFLLVVFAAGVDGGLVFVIGLVIPAVVTLVVARAMPGEPAAQFATTSPGQASVAEEPEVSSRQESGEKMGRGQNYQFEVDSVMYYDGSGRRLGPSVCTVTPEKIIIDDARGGIHQIRVRDISGTGMKTMFPPAKQLRINLQLSTYDIYCKTKNQKEQMEYLIGQSIRGSL
jgi:hypothetical protein